MLFCLISLTLVNTVNTSFGEEIHRHAFSYTVYDAICLLDLIVSSRGGHPCF